MPWWPEWPPFHRTPKLCAQSSRSSTPLASHNFLILSIDANLPRMCETMKYLQSGFASIFFSRSATSTT